MNLLPEKGIYQSQRRGEEEEDEEGAISQTTVSTVTVSR